MPKVAVQLSLQYVNESFLTLSLSTKNETDNWVYLLGSREPIAILLPAKANNLFKNIKSCLLIPKQARPWRHKPDDVTKTD